MLWHIIIMAIFLGIIIFLVLQTNPSAIELMSKSNIGVVEAQGVDVGDSGEWTYTPTTDTFCEDIITEKRVCNDNQCLDWDTRDWETINCEQYIGNQKACEKAFCLWEDGYCSAYENQTTYCAGGYGTVCRDETYSQQECKNILYTTQVNILYNGEFIPFEDFTNVTNPKSGEVLIQDLNKKRCSIRMNYTLSNVLSIAQPSITIKKNRGSWYFTTDAMDNVEDMTYILDCKDYILSFSDDSLKIGNEIKLDFSQARNKQNITTSYDEENNKLVFEIEDGKTGDLSNIDPLITYNFNSTNRGAYLTAIECEDDVGFATADIGGGLNWGTATTLNIDSSEPWIDTGTLTFGEVADEIYDSLLTSGDADEAYHLINDPADNGGGWIFIANVSSVPQYITKINWTLTGFTEDANDLWMRMFMYNKTVSKWYQCANAIGSATPTTSSCSPNDANNFINASSNIHFGVFGDWDVDIGSSNSIAIDYLKLEINSGSPYYINNCSTLNTNGGVYYLTQDITNSATSNCMDITANNVVLDCQGKTIDGNDVADEAIRAVGVKNVTIKNCILNDWDTGAISITSSSNTTINNITTSSLTDDGIEIFLSGDIIINNSIISWGGTSGASGDFAIDSGIGTDYIKVENTRFTGAGTGIRLYNTKYWNIKNTNITAWYPIYPEGLSTAAECSNIFDNVLGVSGKPIIMINTTQTLTNWNSNFSELILCNADNAILDGVNISDVSSDGIFLEGSDRVTIKNGHLKSGFYRIRLDNSDNALIHDNFFGETIGYSGTAIITDGAITGLKVYNNRFYWDDSVDLEDADSSLVYNNSFYNVVGTSVSIGIGSDENMVYNNFFNGTAPTYIFSFDANNYFNVTEQVGTRILSSGPNIGGNYYDNSTGGYSMICDDVECDGFCDDALYGITNAVDYLPLSDKYIDGGCLDTCTCPGAGNNWEVDMADNCVLSDNCDLTTGTLTFINTGTFDCDAQLDTSDLGDPGNGGVLYVNDSCVINII